MSMITKIGPFEFQGAFTEVEGTQSMVLTNANLDVPAERVISLVTHFKGFHADEVMSTAMFMFAFRDAASGIAIKRVNYQLDNEALDAITGEKYIYDVGRIYNPDAHRFDHHQFRPEEDGRASAGMVFDYLCENGDIDSMLASRLKPLVKMVDDNDIGIRAAEIGELPWIIAKMNGDDVIYNNNEFLKAVNLVYEIIEKLSQEVEKTKAAIAKVDEAVIALAEDGTDHIVMDLGDGYIEGWEEALTLSHNPAALLADVVIWKDTTSGEYKAQTVPFGLSAAVRFRKKGRSIGVASELPEDVTFVHANEFFMVARTKEALVDYLKDNLYYKED